MPAELQGDPSPHLRTFPRIYFPTRLGARRAGPRRSPRARPRARLRGGEGRGGQGGGAPLQVRGHVQKSERRDAAGEARGGSARPGAYGSAEELQRKKKARCGPDQD